MIERITKHNNIESHDNNTLEYNQLLYSTYWIYTLYTLQHEICICKAECTLHTNTHRSGAHRSPSIIIRSFFVFVSNIIIFHGKLANVVRSDLKWCWMFDARSWLNFGSFPYSFVSSYFSLSLNMSVERFILDFFFSYYYLSDAFINVIFLYCFSFFFCVFIQFHQPHKRRNNWIRIYGIHAYDALINVPCMGSIEMTDIFTYEYIKKSGKWCAHTLYTNITNIDSRILYFILSESLANISSASDAKMYDHHHNNRRWYFYNVFLISRNVHRMRYVIHAPIPDTQSQNRPMLTTYRMSIWSRQRSVFYFLFLLWLFQVITEQNGTEQFIILLLPSQNWFLDIFSFGRNG